MLVKKPINFLKSYSYIYFLGIGGIGMSSMARYFKSKNMKIYGYDSTPTALTTKLMYEGMVIHHDNFIDSIPDTILLNPDKTLVIYTPAIAQDHILWQYLKKCKYTLKKRAEILGMLSQHYFTIAIAGTHGKTTITALIAHMLYKASYPFLGFLGGIVKKYNTNFFFNYDSKDTILLVEADEYDRSFLELNPNIAVVTSIDEDHLEVYNHDRDLLYKAFQQFLQKKKASGKSIIAYKLFNALCDNDALTYGLNKGDINAQNIQVKDKKYVFDCILQKKHIKDISVQLLGEYNIENTLVAITVGEYLGLNDDVIRNALLTFPGIQRRFEIKINKKNIVWIDDYAHHPKEIISFLQAVKEIYPNHYLKVIFQPHLYSRTKKFSVEFAQSLSLADEVFLLPIYPAREKIIPGVTSKCILEHITTKKNYIEKDFTDFFSIPWQKPTVLATVGAGDVATIFYNALVDNNFFDYLK